MSKIEVVLTELAKVQKSTSEMKARLEEAKAELARLKEDQDDKFTKGWNAAGDSYKVQVMQIAEDIF